MLDKNKQKLSNLLLIAGTGRNTGKTSLACEIIKKVSQQTKVIGVKISPHFHGGTESLKSIVNSDKFNLYEESSIDSNKDSSKMLLAGANQVFYMEVFDDNILEAFKTLLEYIPANTPIVCESPALRKVIEPGLFIIVDNISQQNKKQDVLQRKDKADFFIETDKTELELVVNSIRYDSAGWKKR